jgi:hypothetical protein
MLGEESKEVKRKSLKKEVGREMQGKGCGVLYG